MSLIREVTNFLCDDENIINIYSNSVHISKVLRVLTLNEDNVIIKLVDNSLIKLNGNNFRLIKITSLEVYLSGIVKYLEIIK